MSINFKLREQLILHRMNLACYEIMSENHSLLITYLRKALTLFDEIIPFIKPEDYDRYLLVCISLISKQSADFDEHDRTLYLDDIPYLIYDFDLYDNIIDVECKPDYTIYRDNTIRSISYDEFDINSIKYNTFKFNYKFRDYRYSLYNDNDILYNKIISNYNINKNKHDTIVEDKRSNKLSNTNNTNMDMCSDNMLNTAHNNKNIRDNYNTDEDVNINNKVNTNNHIISRNDINVNKNDNNNLSSKCDKTFDSLISLYHDVNKEYTFNEIISYNLNTDVSMMCNDIKNNINKYNAVFDGAYKKQVFDKECTSFLGSNLYKKQYTYECEINVFKYFCMDIPTDSTYDKVIDLYRKNTPRFDGSINAMHIFIYMHYMLTFMTNKWHHDILSRTIHTLAIYLAINSIKYNSTYDNIKNKLFIQMKDCKYSKMCMKDLLYAVIRHNRTFKFVNEEIHSIRRGISRTKL